MKPKWHEYSIVLLMAGESVQSQENPAIQRGMATWQANYDPHVEHFCAGIPGVLNKSMAVYNIGEANLSHRGLNTARIRGSSPLHYLTAKKQSSSAWY